MLQFNLKRITKFLLIGLLALVVVYGIGRLVHVYMGNFYNGVRSPYLQMVSQDAITVRWQTEQEMATHIHIGETLQTLQSYSQSQEKTNQHEVRISGLKPGTRYYYAIYNEDKALYYGPEYWFKTAPASDSMYPVRLWVLGDPGWKGEVQTGVTLSALNWMQATPFGEGRKVDPDLVLTTGDNAYTSGTNEQFQRNFFFPFEDIFKNIPVWPAYGNHDARRWAFFNIFTFPESGESGGVPSGTEHYYSFDYGQAHVIMLDTEDNDLSPGSEMLTWLKEDLNQTTKPWKIAILHSPPYTRGSHNSDSWRDSRGRMVEARENIVPILEQAGVQLVLSGHSHMYERSYRMSCHYGYSDSFNDTMKNPGGTYYAVVGSSAKVDHGTLDHPAMQVAEQQAASMVIDISEDVMRATVVNNQQQVIDQFVIKSLDKPVNLKCN